MWGEKGDLGRLCLSVLHVLCILSFVMISASAEGGMLASRVQERGGLMGDWGAVQSNFADLGVVPVIPTSPACRHIYRQETSHPWTLELAATAPNRIYVHSQSQPLCYKHTRSFYNTASHGETCITQVSTHSRYSNPEIQQSSSLLSNNEPCLPQNWYCTIITEAILKF